MYEVQVIDAFGGKANYCRVKYQVQAIPGETKLALTSFEFRPYRECVVIFADRED